MRSASISILPLLLLAGGISACGTGEQSEAPEAAVEVSGEEASGAPVIEPWGYPLDALDRSVAPGDDFFRFANGGWLDATPIPADRSGTGFSIIMQERNDARMAEIIASLRGNNFVTGTNEQKIGDLYASYMDQDRIESLGLAPFEADLERLRSATSHAEIAAMMGDPAAGVRSIFGVFVGIDSKAPDTYTVWAGQSGLGLPDRSYYLRDNAKIISQREAYQAHIDEVLGLLGEGNSTSRAEAVMAFESALAELHWNRADRRDATRTYNPVSFDELRDQASGFPWAEYMEARGIGAPERIILREADTFAPVAELFANTDVSVLRDYLMFHYVSANADFMPSQFADANFAFYGGVLRGQEEQRPRDKRALRLVDGRLNQAIGKIYIERYFPEESKVQMTEIFENIRAAFSARIDGLEWMTDETKAAAQTKLAAMTGKIAYPEKWRDYSALEIQPDDLIGNIRRARAEANAFQNARLGTTVDKSEWTSGPQTINAFYSPNRNEAFIPAGYIQSPLFDPNADPALNYGAIGSIIGHEIGHGFDDQGSRYDANGVLQSWWTDEDRAAFDALGDELAAQFDTYESLPGIYVNGRQTLGENIGDVAGILVAYHAYLLSLDGEEPPVLDGFTGAQRVFLGRAQGRRFKRTEESLRQRLLSGVHSPMNLRVNGMIRNMDEWYEAFDIGPEHDLYLPPEERVKIW